MDEDSSDSIEFNKKDVNISFEAKGSSINEDREIILNRSHNDGVKNNNKPSKFYRTENDDYDDIVKNNDIEEEDFQCAKTEKSIPITNNTTFNKIVKEKEEIKDEEEKNKEERKEEVENNNNNNRDDISNNLLINNDNDITNNDDNNNNINQVEILAEDNNNDIRKIQNQQFTQTLKQFYEFRHKSTGQNNVSPTKTNRRKKKIYKLLLGKEKSKEKKEIFHFRVDDRPKKVERVDRNGVTINKKNKKLVHVTFLDRVTKEPLTNVIKVPSYKKYNVVCGIPKEERRLNMISNNTKNGCQCCEIF